MATDNKCVEYARDCVRLAGLTTDLELREQFLNIARDWMASARHEPKLRASRLARAKKATETALSSASGREAHLRTEQPSN